jgi:hypothetical protein
MANRWKGNFVVATAATSSGTDYTGKANGAWGLNSQLQQKQGGLWAKGVGAPSAPTIGTATAGNAQSIVSFTAPADTGGLSITSYTVTSSTGGITATGSVSPITITGLTNGTTYTFTVTATNDSGTGLSSSPSNSVTPSAGPAIGDPLGGGYYAGQINVSGTTYNLIVSPRSSGEASSKTWGTYLVTTGITSPINGPTNSSSLAALGADYQAAIFCEGLNIGGYSDWYMPARNELEVLYYFLKPTTGNNNTASGANANAVSPEPVNTTYTTGRPAQTTATSFKTGGTEAFSAGGAFYMSSTENNQWSEFGAYFSNGNQDNYDKNISNYVRAVRRMAV